MTDNSWLVSLVRNPVSFSILILSLIIVVVWLDQRSSSNTSAIPNMDIASSNAALEGNTLESGAPMEPFTLKQPSAIGRSMPKILQDQGGSEEGSKLTAPGLEGLVAGLEAKVAADPTDVNRRILLAQTYKEIGMEDKSLNSLREMRKEMADNSRVKLVLASVLSQRDDEKDLNESMEILNALSKDKTVQQYLVQLYIGDTKIRQKDHKGALENWKQALTTMPQNDNRYAMLEKRITDLQVAPEAAPPLK